MTKNPILNSLLATTYIGLVGFFMNYVSKNPPTGPDSFLAPVALISLFTLSAAMMGLMFGYQPFKLYFDGKKKEATSLFFKTLLTFALTTSILLGLILGGVIGVK